MDHVGAVVQLSGHRLTPLLLTVDTVKTAQPVSWAMMLVVAVNSWVTAKIPAHLQAQSSLLV